ncbi:MAG: hypothetical protein PHG20_13175, partial [Geobacteraceae bacterium]|nr:hypothetical protein [Geobacteraceae bacterium]
GIDTGTAVFEVPAFVEGDPGLDFSVKEDGTLVFYAKRSTEEWQDVPSALFSLDEFGHVTVYQLSDTKVQQTIEFRKDRSVANVTQYDEDGRVKTSYAYNPGGTKILSRSDYTYASTDKEHEDFRLLKMVETYNLGDLNILDISKLPAAGGTLESRSHYLSRHAETPKEGEAGNLSEATLGRFDYLGLGLVDYTESYLKPLELGGDPVFQSIVQQQYNVFQLVRSVTYKNLTSSTVCGEGFGGCEMTSMDEFTYYPGTNDIDFTTRWSLVGNSFEGKVKQSVYRTEQVDDGVSVTHDFGNDFMEDTDDDTFTVTLSREVSDQLDGNAAITEWGSETRTYTGISDVTLTQKGGYKTAYEKSAFEGLKSHSIQYDVYGDGTLTRSQNFEFVQGVETGQSTFSEARKMVGTMQGYEGTLVDTLLAGLSPDQREQFRGQDFTFSRSWQFGFDRAEEDRIFRSESYSVTSRDERTSRTVSRDVITDLLTYTHQEEIVDATAQAELLGLGGLQVASGEPLSISWSYAGAFNSELQFLIDKKISLDVYGEGSLVRTKNFIVENGAETGEINFSETKDILQSEPSYDWDLAGGGHTVGELLLGPEAGKVEWSDPVSRTQTWTQGFSTEASARRFEGESYSLSSADGKITRNANWDAIKGEVYYNYTEQVKVSYDTTTVGGVRVGETLLGDVAGSANWNPKTILYMTSSRDAFYVSNRFMDSESYQVTSRDRMETRTLNVDRYHPDGPKVSYSSSVRVTRAQITELIENDKNTILAGDAQAFLEVFQDGEFASNPFYLVTGSLQGFNVSDRALISKTYQVSARDGDTTHSLQVDDRVPEGYPVLTYQKQERVRLVDIAGGTVDVFDPVGGATRVVTVEGLLNDPSLIFVPPYDTVLDSGKTLRETIQEALRVNPYAMFSMTSS